MKSIADRFWPKVKKGTGCWTWTASKDRKGYGQFMLAGARLRRAHRIAWELVYGPVPQGKFLLHVCDNRICVRPSHLRPGNNRDNMHDASQKGRLAQKLNWQQVNEIRGAISRGAQLRELARRYGVNPCTISDIKAHRTWKLQ